MMTEKIGKITLDYKHYPGVDLYCDGVIEDELLTIVKEHTREEYQEIIEKRADWPTLYHLSPLRENIVDWLPMDATTKVLEVGSGCGAITGALARKAGDVTCIDLSKKRSMINAYRNQDSDNVMIHVGNFKDIEPELPNDYDYILLIGVFEYGQGYMGTDTPYEDFLAILKKHMNHQGRLVIAIENKFGLKYWAGCKEDHFGTYFSGIEDYPEGGGVRTFTRRGLERIMKANQIAQYSFYYPYPDYKFMTTIYSDAYLPRIGELSANLRNFDRDRMYLFDEKNAFDNIIREGVFDEFSNSYLVVIGEPLPVKYAKFSNDRAEQFAISTEIHEDAEGSRTVYKKPIGEKAKNHIKSIKDSYAKLQNRFAGSKFQINRCEEEGEALRFEYLQGKTLAMLLDECLDSGDEVRFRQLVDEFEEALNWQADMPVNDYDLVFSNVLVDEKTQQWTVIDYEWTFDKKIPVKQNLLRALYCYLIEAERRRKLSFDLIKEKCGIEEKDIMGFAEEELQLQRYVTGQRMSMVELRNAIDQQVIPVQKMALRHADTWSRKKVQVYLDKGNGFNEEDSYFAEAAYGRNDGMNEGQHIHTTIECGEDVKQLRIDPALEACIVRIEHIIVNNKCIWNGEVQKGHHNKHKACTINGKQLGEQMIVFGTADPNITIDVSKELGKKKIEISMEIVSLPLKMAEQLEQGLMKKSLF